MGDIGYNLNDKNGQVGDDYLNMIEPIAANFPYMTIPGNHEKYKNFTHYKNRFNMPKNDENQGLSLFYSINIGPVHFVMYNTNAYFYNTSLAEPKTQTN